MTIVQITPGAGGMYCGNCLRDNALVAALRQQGHAVLMVPLMRWYPPAGPLLFGSVVSLCFFVPGLKYYRQQARRA